MNLGKNLSKQCPFPVTGKIFLAVKVSGGFFLRIMDNSNDSGGKKECQADVTGRNAHQHEALYIV